MRYSYILLTLGLSVLYPFAVWAGQKTNVIYTPGFTISFPSQWHAETDNVGTIIADIKDGLPPMVIIYYATRPVFSDADSAESYNHLKGSTIADVIGQQKLRDMIDESTWHSEIKPITLSKSVTGEALAFEGVSKENGKKTPVCAFLRRYHAPHAEVYFALTVDETCMQGQPEFEKLTKSIVWKTP